MKISTHALSRLAALALLAVTALGPVTGAAADLKGGTLRVAILADINDFDPQAFLGVNFPLIKNFYDSLIEYSPDGAAIPSLATSWSITDDNQAVTLTLRDDVTFHSGASLDAEAVAATLDKAAKPDRGKQVYATMSIVRDWTVVDTRTIRLNFNNRVPDKQITDLLQFISVIDPAGIDTVENKPAGTGAYTLAERVLGQSIRMTANPNYWRPGQPVANEVVMTVFSDNDAASAALESGAVDLIYGGNARSAVRLRNAGYQLIQGPGPLVQVFRINTTKGPFRNEKFRQAFNHLMPREAILKVGYAGVGAVTALPWAVANPAADPSFNTKYAYDLDKARALLSASGLSATEMSDWKLLANGANQDAINISQIVQSTLKQVDIGIELELREGAEFRDAMLKGGYTAVFAGIGNVQKFPSRVATNSIYRTKNNPILGEPHPHPEYVAAIERVNSAFGDDVRAAYDHLNAVLAQSAFGVPTNTYDIGLIVAAPNVSGFTLDIDNMLVARTIGFAR